MIKASVTIHESARSGTAAGELLHTRHTFEYQSNMRGDVNAEISNLCAFLEKLRTDSLQCQVDEDQREITELGGLLIKLLTLTRGAIPIGTDTLNRIQKDNLWQATSLLREILSEYFPATYTQYWAAGSNDD